MAKKNFKDSKVKEDEMRGASKSDANKSESNNRRNSRGAANRSRRKSVDADNDPLWYNNNSQLVFDAGTFSFNTAIGTIESAYGETFSVPGVCAIGISPIPFVSNSSSDPVNITARALYSNVLKANSRANPPYDAPDMMMYLIAVANAYSALYWGRRIYGLANTYSQYNRYIPRAVFAADGLDFESFINDMPGFRYALNRFATELATYIVPKQIPYFQRMAWLFSNIYMDEPTNRASLYMYHPEGFGIWTDMAVNGSSIVWYGNGPVHADMSNIFNVWDDGYTISNRKYMTAADVKDMFATMINALRDSTDVNIISGDILKAFGAENALVPDYTPETYTVAPVYSGEVLTQIHNATLCGSIFATDAPTALTQDVNTLNIYSEVKINPLCTGQMSYDSQGDYELDDQVYLPNLTSTDRMLDMPMDKPTSDDVLVATRLTTTLGIDAADVTTGGHSNSVELAVPKASGSDFATTAYIVSYNQNRSLEISEPISTFKFCYVGQTDASKSYPLAAASPIRQDSTVYDGLSVTVRLDESAVVAQLAKAAVFEYFPYLLVHLWYTVGSSNYMHAIADMPFGDINNYISVSEDALTRLHTAAMFSLFNVPGIAVSATGK